MKIAFLKSLYPQCTALYPQNRSKAVRCCISCPCYVTNYPKCNGLKQTLIISHSCCESGSLESWKPEWFCLRASHKVSGKMLARAAAMWRLAELTYAPCKLGLIVGRGLDFSPNGPTSLLGLLEFTTWQLTSPHTERSKRASKEKATISFMTQSHTITSNEYM